MNQPSLATATESTATEGESAGMPSLEERIAGVNDYLDAASSETAGEPEEAASLAAAKPPAPPAASDDAAAQRAAERRARLEALSLKTRDQVDRKAAQTAADKMARDLQTFQRRAEEAERQAASRVDVSQLDEAAFFALAEKRQISPQRLGEWIRDAMTDPGKVAEAAALRTAQSTFDPKLAALEAQIARQNEQIQGFLAQQQQAQAQAVERQQTQEFLGYVTESAERAPLAAKLLASNEDEFLQIASIAAERVPGMGPEALLDAVEDVLDGDGRKVAQTYAALYGITSPAPAPTTPTTRGAAKPTTVSNSLAQERASLVDEEDFARLPIEERAARLIRSMR